MMKCEKCGVLWGNTLWSAETPLSLCNPCARTLNLTVLTHPCNVAFHEASAVCARYRAGAADATYDDFRDALRRRIKASIEANEFVTAWLRKEEEKQEVEQ